MLLMKTRSLADFPLIEAALAEKCIARFLFR